MASHKANFIQYAVSGVVEVFRTFLAEPKFWSGKDTKSFPYIFQGGKKKEVLIQEVLLTLKPIERVILVWRDILGFQIVDMMSVINHPKEELCSLLSSARRQLMSQLKLAGLLHTN